MSDADIVIAACGVPGLVRAHWLKPGAIVIDVGISFVEDPSDQAAEGETTKGWLCGDVEFNEECL